MTGTNYYTAEGKIDSTEYYETVEDDTGKSVMQATRSRTLSKPGYDLVQVLVRKGTRPWTLVQQDSVVAKGTVRIIYSKGETNAVTTCVSDRKSNASSPGMAKPGIAYDVTGRRFPASNRAQSRLLKAAARKN